MTSTLTTFVNRALPISTRGGVTYNASRNMYVSNGYTSGMGHHYFQGVQLNDRVAVVYDIGRGGWGWNPYFLNGVTVYCYDGHDKKVIGRWFPQSYAFYSDGFAQRVAAELLFDYLKSQMRMQGAYISDGELRTYSRKQIEAAATTRDGISA